MNRPEEEAGGASDERLLAEFLAGDEVAFRRLVEKHSEELYRFVARFVRSTAVAEDVVQETFVQVFQSAGSFDSAKRFRPWLFTIAANKARDHLRSRVRRREVPLTSTSPGGEESEVSYLDFLADDLAEPGSAMEDEESRQRVRDIVTRMPENLREVLVLGYYQRFAYKEIAEMLSIPLGTVKSRLHAAVSYFAEMYRRDERRRQAHEGHEAKKMHER
ncbi:MAG TPA: sigma-70 family RNA polymerase sigma factor [Phycisphaerae bacterium]|nr:sigma-70 family RNA polymerase sigma factor [Phycisphaerae bacterium]